MRILLPTSLERTRLRFRPSHLIAATVLSVILPAAATQAYAQGFGFKRSKSTLTYKWPARVYLANATFAVRVSSQAKLASPAVEQMREFLEGQSPQHKPGLKTSLRRAGDCNQFNDHRHVTILLPVGSIERRAYIRRREHTRSPTLRHGRRARP